MALENSIATLPGGLNLTYAATGRASAWPVVFLPGPTDSWRSYEPVLRELPDSIRGVAVSQRGHAGSDEPIGGYGVEDFASDVVSFLDALGAERAVLAGHSGSCLVARRVAIDQPARVAGLVLEASPLTLRDDPKLQDFVASVVTGLEDPIDEDFVRSFVGMTSSDHVTRELLEALVDDVMRVPARVWKDVFAGLLAYDDSAELLRIGTPTLLIWGAEDQLVDRQAQDALLDRIPRAELIVYAGVGHTPRWENPARYAADVTAFVGALEGQVRRGWQRVDDSRGGPSDPITDE